MAQRRRNHVHVLLVIHHEFSHEAVGAFDAALGEVAGVAEVLAAGPASDAILVRAGTPHHRHHQVALPDARDAAAYFHDLTQGFVADNQAVLTGRRDTVVEAADLAVGAADTHLQHA